MYDYPLDAIGQYFEMPTKEAFLDKIKPTLTFIDFNDGIVMLGLVMVGIVGLAFFLANRGR